MTTLAAALVLLTLLIVVLVPLERTHHRRRGLPRAPFGAGVDHDLDRVLHDLTARC